MHSRRNSGAARRIAGRRSSRRGPRAACRVPDEEGIAVLQIMMRKIARLTVSGMNAPVSKAPAAVVSPRVVEEAAREHSTVLLSLLTSADGLSRLEAVYRRSKEGPNEIAHERPPRWYVQLLL